MAQLLSGVDNSPLTNLCRKETLINDFISNNQFVDLDGRGGERGGEEGTGLISVFAFGSIFGSIFGWFSSGIFVTFGVNWISNNQLSRIFGAYFFVGDFDQFFFR